MNPTTPFRLGSLFACLVLSAAACGGGGGGGAIEIEDLGAEVSTTLCESQVRCGLFPDLASCEESLGLDVDQLVADVNAGLIDYDGSKARECLEKQFTSDCSIFGFVSDEVDPSCDLTFVGNVAIGGDCFTDESCAGAASCEDAEPDTCAKGTCVAEPAPAKVGQSCAQNDCEAGLHCDEAELCAAPAGPGQACASFTDCVTGHICDVGPDFTPGTCIKVPTTGETCDPEFGGPFIGGQLSCLKINDFCDPSDTKCKAKLAVSSTCGEGLENACVGYASCVEGTCVAKPGLGDSCVVDSELECLGGLDCENGKCTGEPSVAVCPL